MFRENLGQGAWFAPGEMFDGRGTGKAGKAVIRVSCLVFRDPKTLACISHHPTVEAHDTTARTSLRLLAVLNVRFKYACARQAARASS